MLLIIGIIIIVCIFILLNFDSSLKHKINIIINLLFAIVLLLILNAYLLYPQYKNIKDTQYIEKEIIQELNDFLQNWNESQPRTHGTR